MTKRLAVLGLLLAGTASCDGADVIAPGQPLSGRLALTAMAGRPVPVTIGEILTRDRRSTGCFEVVVGGWLNLDARAGTFSMGALHRDTCGFTRFGSDTSATGRYTQRGAELRFAADAGPGRTVEFTGRALDGLVEVVEGGDVYQYGR